MVFVAFADQYARARGLRAKDKFSYIIKKKEFLESIRARGQKLLALNLTRANK